MNSIRQRLLFWQIGALVVTSVLVSAFTYHLAWQAFNRVRDFGMEQIAHSVVRHGVRPHSWTAEVPQHAQPRPEARPAPAANPPPWVTDDLGRFISQIWSRDGDLLYASVDGIGPPLQSPGYHDVEWSGEGWRVFTLMDDEEIVQVAKTTSDRASSFASMVPWLLVPIALLVLTLSVLIRIGVHRALAPLDALGQDIGRRDEKDLRPVATTGLPDELAPLGQALNQLLDRVARLLSRQRQMLADAAHELNTPLAAVKLQAQLVRRAPQSGQAAALDELDQGIARSTHLVAQLLQMARLEADGRERQPVPVRLDELAANAVASFSSLAESRGIDLGLDTDLAATVLADPQDLRLLLDNLVDNALRHTPPGSRVDLRIEQDADRVSLVVNDNGPGIAEADRQRVLQRFVRLNPQDQDTGSGLGLAIGLGPHPPPPPPGWPGCAHQFQRTPGGCGIAGEGEPDGLAAVGAARFHQLGAHFVTRLASQHGLGAVLGREQLVGLGTGGAVGHDVTRADGFGQLGLHFSAGLAHEGGGGGLVGAHRGVLGRCQLIGLGTGGAVGHDVTRADGFGQLGLHFGAGLALGDHRLGVLGGEELVVLGTGLAVGDQVTGALGGDHFGAHLFAGLAHGSIGGQGVAGNEGGESDGNN
jgi:two-component system OmpR family sensor kinase